MFFGITKAAATRNLEKKITLAPGGERRDKSGVS